MEQNSSQFPENVRLAQLDDVPALKRLIAASSELLAACYSPEQVEAFLAFALTVDLQLIADQTYFVAEHEGQVIAAGGWSFRPHSIGARASQMVAPERLDPFTQSAVLRLFFVHPRHARRGLGRLLVSTAEGAAMQAGYRWADLTATLSGAPLYLACGFEIVEQFEAPFPNGVRAIGYRMIKTLRPERRQRIGAREPFLARFEGAC
ncbi:MAG TPA: GNAT family N-acetyltransferase [Tepidisphaeraceae bacterium]|jgi:GNAT superfamily N-acetyltransferase